MQIQLETQPFASIQADALVTYVFDKENKLDGLLGEMDRAMNGRLSSLAANGEITGKMLETLLLHFPEGLASQKLLLVGAGKPDRFSLSDLRKIAGTAVRQLKSRGAKKIVFLAREGERDPAAAQAVVEGLIAADFESDKYRSDRKNREIQSVGLAGFDAGLGVDLAAAVNQGTVIAESQNFARDLINEPSNKMTPRILAARAEAMATEAGLGIEILDERKIAELKMGALIGVAQGSVEPPRVIVLRYDPANPKPGAPVLGLIGKAVTFDTGGISIKPADKMYEMKGDMSGGAAVLYAMQVIGKLKPEVNVTGIIPTAENFPDANAQRPGDIFYAKNGKSIMVDNTDAEGRLILTDGLHLAGEEKATHILDIATLTGACVRALGLSVAGVMGNDSKLVAAVMQSGQNQGEAFWELPLPEEYKDLLKTPYADINNIGGPVAGALTAGLFLQEFVPARTAWAHLDIAGPFIREKDWKYYEAGAIGFGLKTLVDVAERFSDYGL
jgi:leucyl aminopeptidase